MKYSPKEALKTIQLVHFALMAGIVLFTAVILFLYFDGVLAAKNDGIIQYIPALFFFAVLPSSSMVYKQALKNVDAQANLQSKMKLFQTAHIVRMAILEGSALFAAAVSFVTGSLYQLIIVGLVIAVFASKIPSIMMLESDLHLTSEDKEKFR